MALAVDYASGPIAPTALLAAGVTDVCRYLAPLGRGDWKRIKVGEYRDLLAAGLRVTLVWESYATDWLGGGAAGREHGVEAGRQATDLGYPAGATVFGSCDFDLAATEWPACRDYVAAFAAALHAGGYRPGVYGPWDALQRCADAGLVAVFWQAGMSRAWSQGRNARDHPRAHLIQRAPARIGGTPVDRSDIVVPAWGQASTSGAVMTYAPADLLAVRQYVMGHTGLDASSVGIAGDPAHASSGGYHEGNDDLANAGRLDSDYSKRESPRDRPGSNAASAEDIGDFNRDGKTLRQLSLFVVAKCQAGDPRCNDIREIIYTPDGSAVRRFDRLGIRSTGDSSHLYHTHLSFFRDSEGRRAGDGNFLGLLREFFEGVTMGSEWHVGEPNGAALTQGAPGYAGQQRDTALAFTWQQATTAAAMAAANGAKLDQLLTAATAETARDAALKTVVDALAAAITAGGGSVDVAAILAGVADAVHDAVEPLETEIADLRHRLAAAERAAADSLDS